MKCASVSRTLLSPFSFLRQMERSSEDSSRAIVHVSGGERKRSQFRQNDTEADNRIRSAQFRRGEWMYLA